MPDDNWSKSDAELARMLCTDGGIPVDALGGRARSTVLKLVVPPFAGCVDDFSWRGEEPAPVAEQPHKGEQQDDE